MANTTNLDLVKPAGTDHALVSVLNSNSDKIDAWAGTTNTAITKLGVYTMSSSQELLTVARDNTICPENTVRWINPRNGTVSGGATQFGMACVSKRLNSAIQVIVYSDLGAQFSNSWDNTNSVWRGWQQLAKKTDLFVALGSITGTGTTKNVTIPSSSNHILIGTANDLAHHIMLLVSCTSDGTVIPVEIYKGTAFSISTSTNTLSITKAGSGGTAMYGLVLSGNSITW